MSNRSIRFSSLGADAVSFLEEPFFPEEIKEVVWDCGGDRASGSDGFFPSNSLDNFGMFYVLMSLALFMNFFSNLLFLWDVILLLSLSYRRLIIPY